jgi:hypothetical protein
MKANSLDLMMPVQKGFTETMTGREEIPNPVRVL